MAASVVIVINKGTAVAAHLRVRDRDNSHCHFLLRYAPHRKIHPTVGLWLIGTTKTTAAARERPRSYVSSWICDVEYSETPNRKIERMGTNFHLLHTTCRGADASERQLRDDLMTMLIDGGRYFETAQRKARVGNAV